MYRVNIFNLVFYSLIANTIINILIGLFNKDFRKGNHISDLAQLKGLWLIVEILSPFFLFPKVINSLVKNEKEQAREEKMKNEIRRKNLNNKKRRR